MPQLPKRSKHRDFSKIQFGNSCKWLSYLFEECYKGEERMNNLIFTGNWTFTGKKQMGEWVWIHFNAFTLTLKSLNTPSSRVFLFSSWIYTARKNLPKGELPSICHHGWDRDIHHGQRNHLRDPWGFSQRWPPAGSKQHRIWSRSWTIWTSPWRRRKWKVRFFDRKSPGRCPKFPLVGWWKKRGLKKPL